MRVAPQAGHAGAGGRAKEDKPRRGDRETL